MLDHQTLKSILFGLLIGLTAGPIVLLYRYAIFSAEIIRKDFYNLSGILIIVSSILLGLVVIKLLQFAPYSGGSGIPQVRMELEDKIKTDGFKVSISKFFGGFSASIVGLSVGREGPSIQLGSAFSQWIGKLLKLSAEEIKIFTAAGATAGLSAAFSAPIAALLFIIEELEVKDKNTIYTAFTASVVADVLAVKIFQMEPVFHFNLNHMLSLNYYRLIVIMSMFIGIIALLFNKSILIGQDIYKKIPLSETVKTPLYFGLISLCGIYNYHLLGSGHDLIESLVLGNNVAIGTLIILLIGKFLLTVFSYSSKAQGGIFLPVLVIGGLCGFIFFKICLQLGLIPSSELSNFIVIAMTAMLSGVVRSPILSVILLLELNGNLDHMLSFGIASIVAYFTTTLLGSEPIYDSLLERLKPGNIE